MTSRPVPARSRTLAGRLADAFARDEQLAERLNDAHRRLRHTKDERWSGLDPAGLSAVYGDHPQFETVRLEAAVSSRSAVLGSGDPLGQLPQAHWQIHQAHHDYQAAAEDRRVLAAEMGELIARMVDALVAVGWSESEARNANVHELAAGPNGRDA